MSGIISDLRNRLLASIDIDKETNCWNWIAATSAKGYGQIRLLSRAYYTHRISYELEHGDIPEGMCVCHRCDNPACVNPEHLFLGTNADNMADKIAKGRESPVPGIRGIDHYRAKLSEDDVIAIRSAPKSVSHRELASKYGNSIANISWIRNGKGWKHVIGKVSGEP